MRIMVIEDSPIDRRITRLAIEQIDDVALVETSNGGTAIELAEDFEPDLILVDWSMGNVSGQSVIEHYRETGGGARIIVTAHESERNDMIAALRAGANHFVMKPFAPATLHKCIERVMSRGQ